MAAQVGRCNSGSDPRDTLNPPRPWAADVCVDLSGNTSGVILRVLRETSGHDTHQPRVVALRSRTVASWPAAGLGSSTLASPEPQRESWAGAPMPSGFAVGKAEWLRLCGNCHVPRGGGG